jgi:hypothetical protein
MNKKCICVEEKYSESWLKTPLKSLQFGELWLNVCSVIINDSVYHISQTVHK